MLKKERLYWTLQIGGWLLYALFQIVLSVAASDFVSTKRIYFFIVEAFLFLIVTHLFRLILIRWNWLSLNMSRLIPRILVSVFVLGMIIYFLRMPLSLFLGLFDIRAAFNLQHLAGLTSIYALMFFVWLVLYFTYHYFERYNKSLKYEASMVEIELNNLRSQLNPHFIFNALNSIRALVDENPDKSKQAINQLANLLRSSLAPDKKGLTNFDEELKIVKDYLGLESIRFEERLRTEFDIAQGSSQFLVPALMVQTLVENGIKHGISRLKEGGLVQLRTSIDNGSLKIQIRNSGQLSSGTKRSKSGLGIKNTIQRLKLIYGEQASFSIINENNNFVLTEITIPQTSFYESLNRG